VQTWTTIPDKTAWGVGPWVDEPDRAQWVDETTNLTCLAKRNSLMGNWCGYVGVPHDHPWHGLDYTDERVTAEVHGGLTYSDACQEGPEPIEKRICHIPEPGEPDDLWWFGWDCGHWMDMSPGYLSRCPEEFSTLVGGYRAQYRTLDYVRSECAALAKQLAETGA